MRRIATVLVMLISSTALADETPYGFGARVGGYGFRSHEEGSMEWDECRMNGVGIFGERRIGKHLFVQAALDSYFSAEQPEPGEMDSAVTASVSAGLRMFPGRWISPFIEAGGGMQWSQVEIAGHDPNNSTMPMGFVGFGADLGIYKNLRGGATFRMNVMPEFEGTIDNLDAEPALATQGQFYLRYDL